MGECEREEVGRTREWWRPPPLPHLCRSSPWACLVVLLPYFSMGLHGPCGTFAVLLHGPPWAWARCAGMCGCVCHRNPAWARCAAMCGCVSHRNPAWARCAAMCGCVFHRNPAWARCAGMCGCGSGAFRDAQGSLKVSERPETATAHSGTFGEFREIP